MTAVLCPDCDPIYYAVCDFCRYYDFNGTKDGKYTGNGWCRFHKRQEDPGSGCDDFHCENVVTADGDTHD